MKVKKKCSVTGCHLASRSKGMCSKHYAKATANPERHRAYIVANPYINLKKSAKQRKVPVDLTKEQYGELRKQPCYYCDGLLPPLGIGLDRKDRTIGYTLDNVVPCCGTCNTFREDRFTVDEMKFLMTQLKIYRAIKK